MPAEHVAATAFDLKVFFGVVGKDPAAVTSADVLAFITAQRHGGDGRLLAVGEVEGVSARSVRRRLSSVSGLFAYLHARGDVAVNLGASGSADTLGTVSAASGGAVGALIADAAEDSHPPEVDALLTALRTHRDRAMVLAMVLGGLRRCEVLGSRLEDLRPGERRVFIGEGKGRHQRIVPVSQRFFTAVGAYLDTERPAGTRTDRVFLALKGQRRGQPLSAYGVDEILSGAKRRAGLAHASCHELRHTCLTRLREARMALETVQAQAGHASIESTRIYLHLADDWLANQYRTAAEAIDAQVFTEHPAAPQPTIDASVARLGAQR